VKAWSVGASPRQLKTDPGASPSPRGHHNVEAPVSFDFPAQLNATLHNAGKVSVGSYSHRSQYIILGC